jgi:hypothetical protein
MGSWSWEGEELIFGLKLSIFWLSCASVWAILLARLELSSEFIFDVIKLSPGRDGALLSKILFLD